MTEAEQGLIGCVLISADSLDRIPDIKPYMFSDDIGQDIFIKMLAMRDNCEEITVLSLAQSLTNPKYSEDEYKRVVASCVRSSPTSVEAPAYAKVVMNDFKAREVKSLYQRVSLRPGDIDKTISESISRLEELQKNMKVRSKSLKQIVEENKEKYFNEHVGEGGVKTGFDQLDDCIGSLEGGDVTIIGARPGIGKSAFVTQMIGQMAEKGLQVGYFNLEMKEGQVYERFVSRLSEISLTRVRRAKAFLGDEKEKFDKANDEMCDYDVIISTGSKSAGEIKAESRYRQFDAIIIDYLQLIKAERKYSNRSSEVGDISKALKALAMELNVPVIALSQLNRVSEGRDTKEPTMSELRESGDIEQDASNIFFLWNLDESGEYKGLKVAKQRQGELMKEALQFIGENMKFVEIEKPFNDVVAEIKKKERGDGFKPYNGDCPF